MIYRCEDNELRFIHLGWHFQLHVDNVEKLSHGYYVTQINVEEVDKKFVAALCNLIAEKHPDIPYGISSTGVSFDQNNGNLIIQQEGSGLTCATFVLTVFEEHGLILLKKEEWPEGVNFEWAQGIINQLKNEDGVRPEYIEMMERDAANVQRFRPEEVAGSAPLQSWPIGFAQAFDVAEKILSELS